MATIELLYPLVVFLLSLPLLSWAQPDGETHQQNGGSDYFKREHSLVQPYTGSGMDIPLWDFGGSTVVTNDYIRLTPDRQSKQGHLWNHVASHMRHWEVRVTFMVHGSGKSLYGDGFAFWYARDRMEFGPIFGSRDKYSGLGIFLDTYSNFDGDHAHLHPYISAMVNNGTMSYDHDHDGTHGQMAGCSVNFRNGDYESHMSVAYYMGTLSIYTRVGEEQDWQSCLNIDGVQLPTQYYFGFTAATGDLADNHDIIAVKTYELFPQNDEEDKEGETDWAKVMPAAVQMEKPREHVDSKPHVRKSSIAIYVVIGIVVVCGVLAGVFFYHQKKQQEIARKRFF